jgi:hypothetical protein
MKPLWELLTKFSPGFILDLERDARNSSIILVTELLSLLYDGKKKKKSHFSAD